MKLCQINQPKKNKPESSSNELKCSICKLIFQTGTGLKVHTDIEHPTQPVNEAELKCKHCVITCSDLNVMKKHILHEHKYECTQCPEWYKEECELKTHTTNTHKCV